MGLCVTIVIFTCKIRVEAMISHLYVHEFWRGIMILDYIHFWLCSMLVPTNKVNPLKNLHVIFSYVLWCSFLLINQVDESIIKWWIICCRKSYISPLDAKPHFVMKECLLVFVKMGGKIYLTLLYNISN